MLKENQLRPKSETTLLDEMIGNSAHNRKKAIIKIGSLNRTQNK